MEMCDDMCDITSGAKLRPKFVFWCILSERLEELIIELDRSLPEFKGMYDLYLKETKK